MGESLYAAQGTTADYVITDTNTTGQFDPVLESRPTTASPSSFRTAPTSAETSAGPRLRLTADTSDYAGVVQKR